MTNVLDRMNNQVHAIVEVARGLQPAKGDFTVFHTGAYGAVLTDVFGRPIKELWEAGHADAEDMLRGAAVERLLKEETPAGKQLVVWCKGLREILEHASNSGGTRPTGEPFTSWSLYSSLRRAMEEGRWALKWDAHHKPAALGAARTAARTGLEYAIRLEPSFHDLPVRDPFCLVTNERGDDPHGIIGGGLPVGRLGHLH